MREAIGASICWLGICLLGWISLSSPLLAADGADTRSSHPLLDLNLRLTWGGAKLADYYGTIEVDDGKLSCNQQLGIDPFDAGFLAKDSVGKIPFRDPRTRFGGCDLRVQAKPTSRLKLTIHVGESVSTRESSKEFSWSMTELRDGSKIENLDVGGARISVDRVPGDRLRVVSNRNHFVYNSDEPLGIHIQAHELPWNATVTNLDYTIVRIDDGLESVHQTRTVNLDEHGSSEPVGVLIGAPKEEGVYELRLRMEPKRMLPNLILRHPHIERSIQFVVFNNSPTATHDKFKANKSSKAELKWQLVSRLPNTSFESESLTRRMLNGFDSNKGFPLMDFAKSFSLIRKDSGNTIKGAKSISVAQSPGMLSTVLVSGLVPGQLHRFSFRPTAMDPNIRVQIHSVHSQREKDKLDSLIASQIFELGTQRLLHRSFENFTQLDDGEYEVSFWPSTRSARIEIANLNPTSTLEFTDAKVDVYSNPIGSLESTSSEQRTVLELHSPSFRNTFGFVSKSNGATGTVVYDDWRMFLHFAESIAKYCNANGFDTLALVIDGEGGSLFPSGKLSTNARFDTGTFSPDGRDPIRKDVVELMYRVMNRFQVGFVPMFELNGPLREIEDFRIKAPETDLWQDRNESDDVPRLYNPISSRVQRALANVLDEFESRYRDHSNYQGMALCIGDMSHLSLSTPIDTTNPSILDKFALDVGGNIPRNLSEREHFIRQHAQGMFQQWIEKRTTEVLKNIKTKPRWISSEKRVWSQQSTQEFMVVTPILLSSQNAHAFTREFNKSMELDGPVPRHFAMERTLDPLDNRILSWIELAKGFHSHGTQPVPHRDGASQVSKVRVWFNEDSQETMLVANLGAVQESIQLVWDSLPSQFRVRSSSHPDLDTSASVMEQADRNEWSLEIPPGEIVRIDWQDHSMEKGNPLAHPVCWYGQDKMVLQQMETTLQTLEQGINRLSIPQRRLDFPANGSFENEVSARRGRVDGWTTSLDPNASVTIDSNVAMHGRNSVKIQVLNETSVAWLQSDPFALSNTDRLMLSFQLLADRVPEQATVSLSYFDPQTERFEKVIGRNFSDSLVVTKPQGNGKSLSIDVSTHLQPLFERTDELLCRLQFEVVGQCNLWIDDVSMSSQFLGENERKNIRSELFLARTSLKNRDIGPAVSMLLSPTGRIVAWGDAAFAQSQQPSLSNSESRGLHNTVPVSARGVQGSISNEKEKLEPKPRPLQRVRNYWSQRKE